MCVGKVGLAPGEGLAPRTQEVGAGAARAGGGGRLRALETGDSCQVAGRGAASAHRKGVTHNGEKLIPRVEGWGLEPL